MHLLNRWPNFSSTSRCLSEPTIEMRMMPHVTWRTHPPTYHLLVHTNQNEESRKSLWISMREEYTTFLFCFFSFVVCPSYIEGKETRGVAGGKEEEERSKKKRDQAKRIPNESNEERDGRTMNQRMVASKSYRFKQRLVQTCTFPSVGQERGREEITHWR